MSSTKIVDIGELLDGHPEPQDYEKIRDRVVKTLGESQYAILTGGAPTWLFMKLAIDLSKKGYEVNYYSSKLGKIAIS